MGGRATRLKIGAAALVMTSTGAAANPTDDALAYQKWLEAFRAAEEQIILPVDPRHERLQLTPEWLHGYWVSGKAACQGSDSGIFFGADGRWSDSAGGGLYSIHGELIRLVSSPTTEDLDEAPPSSLSVELVGPNEMEARWENAHEGTLYRCAAPPGHAPAS